MFACCVSRSASRLLFRAHATLRCIVSQFRVFASLPLLFLFFCSSTLPRCSVLRLIRLLDSFLLSSSSSSLLLFFFLSPLRGIIRLSCVDVRTHSYSRPRAFILVGSRREFRRRLLRRAVLCVLCMCTQQSVHSVFCPEDPCFKRGGAAPLSDLPSGEARAPSVLELHRLGRVVHVKFNSHTFFSACARFSLIFASTW